jgi:hypothetical protein
MKVIKVEKLSNYVLMENVGNEVKLVTVKSNKDFNGTIYETISDEDIYCKLIEVLGKTLYVSKCALLESLLSNEIEQLKNGEIFEHGYPESRLIPSTHHQDCIDSFKESIMNNISGLIDEIISNYAL